jgi:predicted translin family RNA/ssDNA-binding protein
MKSLHGQFFHEAADRLRRGVPGFSEAQLAALCADGLQELAEHYDE